MDVEEVVDDAVTSIDDGAVIALKIVEEIEIE